MARRSYLQRIAQPVTASDPGLSPIPRPWPEEARRPAPPLEPDAPATLRRAPLPSALGPAETPAPAISSPSGVPAPDRAVLPAPVGPHTDPVGPSRPMAPERPEREPAANPPADIGLARLPPLSPSSAGAASAAAGGSPPAALPASVWQRDHLIPLDRPAAAPVTSDREAGADPSAAPASARIHIGTVEIRTAPATPQAPPPALAPSARAASRPAGEPLARGFAWRYGLVQG